MRILFFGRDVREGLGERRVFRTVLTHLTKVHTESAKKVIPSETEDMTLSRLDIPVFDISGYRSKICVRIFYV